MIPSKGTQSGLNQSIGFQILVLVLSIYAIGALLVDLAVTLPPHASQMIQHFDSLVCGVFLVDFVLQFRKAPDKIAFLKVGWIDLLASIPSVDFLRWGRIARILRVLRILRAVRGGHKIFKLLCATRGNAGGSAVAAVFLLIVFSSVSILLVETPPEANIKTAGDAVWWSFTTITTVGYGDRYPITPEGRVIAVILMISGVGVLGSVTAMVASYFVGPGGGVWDKNADLTELHAKIDVLEHLIADRLGSRTEARPPAESEGGQ